MRLTRPVLRLAAIPILAAILFGVAAVLMPHSPGAISHLIGHSWAGMLMFVALWALLTPALFSGTILAAAAGLLFGPLTGTALGLAGATLGGLLSFAIARRWASQAFREVVARRGKLKLVEERVAARPLQSVVLLRVMPGMPATWLNYALGLTRVPARTFAAGSLIGAAPRVFIYAGIGGAASGASPAVIALSVSLFVALGAVGVVAALRERRALRALG